MWRSFRLAARGLVREPGFTAVALLTLALGIGANTAIFSVVDTVLLKPLAYRDPVSLYMIGEVVPRLTHLYPMVPVNMLHYLTWRDRVFGFERIAVFEAAEMTLTGSGDPEQIGTLRVSANFLETLGIQPKLGRSFRFEEEQRGRHHVVVLTDSLWRRRFLADPGVVGRTVRLNDAPYLVIGVLPETFRFPKGDQMGGLLRLPSQVELLRPLGVELADLSAYGEFNYSAIARLKRGVTFQRASAELNAVQEAIDRTLPEKLNLEARLVPMQEQLVGQVRTPMLVLLAAIGAVMLIVCVNIANLMLARSTGRARDSAIRTALGASRWRLLRESLAGSLLLAGGGCAAGLVLAYWLLQLLVRSSPVDLPRLDEVALDPRALAFAVVLSAAAALLFGLLPAWRTARADPHDALQSSGGRVTAAGHRRRLGEALVSLEVGLSVALLILAGLLMGSFWRLMRVEKGFQAQNTVAVPIGLRADRYQKQEVRDQFIDRLLANIRSVPGVVSAAIVSALPLQGETWVDIISLPGDTRPLFQRPLTNYRFISPGYVETMRIPILRGRALAESDRGKPRVLIARRVAERVWPGEDPTGKRFRRGTPESPDFEVIGVVEDVRVSLQKDPVLMVYVPYWERQSSRLFLVARTGMDPRSAAAAIRSGIWSVDPEVPVPPLKTLEQVVDDSVAQRKFQMVLAASFAMTALLLASLGIYGVVSYSVARRTNEMGIRMALGAGAPEVRRMVLRQGLVPVWIGLAAGIATSVAFSRVIQSLLFGMKALEPWTIASVAVLLASVAAAACYLPAIRATRIDPSRALRYE